MMRFVFISFYFIYTHRCRLEPAFLGAVCFRVRVVYSEVKCRIFRHHVFRSLLTVNFVPHHRISFITSWKHFRGNFSNVWGVYSRPSFCLSIMVIFVTLGVLILRCFTSHQHKSPCSWQTRIPKNVVQPNSIQQWLSRGNSKHIIFVQYIDLLVSNCHSSFVFVPSASFLQLSLFSL